MCSWSPRTELGASLGDCHCQVPIQFWLACDVPFCRNSRNIFQSQTFDGEYCFKIHSSLRFWEAFGNFGWPSTSPLTPNQIHFCRSHFCPCWVSSPVPTVPQTGGPRMPRPVSSHGRCWQAPWHANTSANLLEQTRVWLHGSQRKDHWLYSVMTCNDLSWSLPDPTGCSLPLRFRKMLNGIENPLVVFIGCCQGLIPHSVAKSWVLNAAFLEPTHCLKCLFFSFQKDIVMTWPIAASLC